MITLSLLALSSFLIPQPWVQGFSVAPRIALAGDIDGDGFGDMISVLPDGDCTIDISYSVGGQKASPGFGALGGWGKNCQSACTAPLDDKPGIDVAGVFDGNTIHIASGFQNNTLTPGMEWAKLPKTLIAPKIIYDPKNLALIVASGKTGDGFAISIANKAITPIKIARNFTWLGVSTAGVFEQDDRGIIYQLDKRDLLKRTQIGVAMKGSIPATGEDFVTWDQTIWRSSGTQNLTLPDLPACPTIAALADVDNDGDLDIFQTRRGSEMHTSQQVELYRQTSPAETDPDHDGLDNESEKRLGTDPGNPDTDNDGILDGWEVSSFRDFDFKANGCNPLRSDVICLISRFDKVNLATMESELKRAKDFYQKLPNKNPDGSTGIYFHPVFLAPVTGDDTSQGWPTNRAKFLPNKWVGLLHWMQVTPGGGGQADQMGNGGSVGEGAMWAVFIHEFGHQMGLDHEGFWKNNLCPIYGSLMNYAYSYGFENDYNKIHYSTGEFKNFVLNETDLDETIPLPLEKVKFLSMGPYNFKLKAAGNQTLIDWNWNGIFGEKHVRADINYSYSTHAGVRDDVGRTKTAPFLFSNKETAYLLYGSNSVGPIAGKDPSISRDNPGSLLIKVAKQPKKWTEPLELCKDKLIGDPVGVFWKDRLLICYPTSDGIQLQEVLIKGDKLLPQPAKSISADSTLFPSITVYQGKVLIAVWNPKDSTINYSWLTKGEPGKWTNLGQLSQNPVGLCTNTKTGELIVGLTQNQGGGKVHRWQVQSFVNKDGVLVNSKTEWVQGAEGGAAGQGRVTVLFDGGKDAGKNGRIYFYCLGLIDPKNPWACAYVGHQIEDKTVTGGWLVKRFYDEWTQSRSAPAAAWVGKDIYYAYRWVNGGQTPDDNTLHIGYQGLGIQDSPMGDHDDVGFLSKFGIRTSISLMVK